LHKKKILFDSTFIAPVTEIKLPEIISGGIQLFIKREDLVDAFISGNKFRKLKYNLIEAKKLNKDTLLTFGGAYSNHIAAVASAGKKYNFLTVGVIRGEELADKIGDNPTLAFARKQGMKFIFLDRQSYRNKTNDQINTFLENHKNTYIIPEGGTNELAVKGCEEILIDADASFDFICTPVGTGGTLTGLVQASKRHQTVIGFSALKGTFQTATVKKFTHQTNYFITDSYCFGGYAKINRELITFINTFKKQHKIQLDPVYTGKMMYGILDMIHTGKIPENSRILAIHTGGLQGIAGMNKHIKSTKNNQIPLIV
jgi:1-aminocyclopropane-1-carboxylate deaminase